MTRLDTERIELREFTAGVLADTARSLELLRAIESTLAWLQRLTGQLKADAIFAERTIAGLDTITDAIDPDDSIQLDLESAQVGIDELHQLLVAKRQSGRNDHRLTEDDGIEGAYTEAIEAAADLHNVINTLRWSIGEHDIDCTPHQIREENLISDPDEIRASLRALRG